jgi:flagellar basal-body rod modification protein FlgD
MSFISPIATDTNGNQKTTGSQQVLGKDDFLQLLVTKLQYQDPLDPVKDEDFVAQLAQFSSLEQMNNIAEGIESSNQWDYLQMQSLNNVMASGLIGREVTADFGGVYLDDDSEPKISYTLSEAAQSVTFEIRDSENKVVATITKEDLEAGSGSITWNGNDRMGNRVAEGYYTVTAEATAPTGETFDPSLKLIGEVTGVTYRDGSAFLIVNGSEIALGDITEIKTPQED